MCGLICDLKKAELGAVISSPAALRLCEESLFLKKLTIRVFVFVLKEQS